ncbi:MAG: aminotransferase class IV [Planctomycetes bacterium]|nr:aminotransferase class IV [Planctomycetota bacterium]
MSAHSVWWNGRLCPWDAERKLMFLWVAAQPESSVELIRVAPTAQGRAVVRLHDHFDRFFAKVAHRGLRPAYSREQVVEALEQVVQAADITNGCVGLVAARNVDFVEPGTPRPPDDTLVVAWEFPDVGEADVQRFNLTLFHRPETGTPGEWRLFPYSNDPWRAALARAAAPHARPPRPDQPGDLGFEEVVLTALFVQTNRGVRENIFLSHAGEVWLTPEPPRGESIARNTFRLIVQEMGVPIRVVDWGEQNVHDAEEAFFAGSTHQVYPIVAFEGRAPKGHGQPGEFTRAVTERWRRARFTPGPKHAPWFTRVEESVHQMINAIYH